MIVVNTSALAAVVLGEVDGPACTQALARESRLLLSAGTLIEALIVAAGKSASSPMRISLRRFSFEVVPVTEGFASKVAEAYAQWGKGLHPAGLNFGDCFAYAPVKEWPCPLLYIGNDFGKTDIASAI